MGFINQKIIPRNPPNFEDYCAWHAYIYGEGLSLLSNPAPSCYYATPFVVVLGSSLLLPHPSPPPPPPLKRPPGSSAASNGKRKREKEEGRPHSPTKQERNYPARTSSVSLGTTGGTFRQLHYRLSFAADKKPDCCADGERKKWGNEGCFYYAARHCVFGQSWSIRKGKRN